MSTHAPSLLSRRQAIGTIAAAIPAATSLASVGFAAVPEPYPISLAQWSLHRAIFAGELDPLDFPTVTRTVYGLAGCE